MFDPFFSGIAWLLAWFYDLPQVGYGGAIALLTVTIMVVVTPLNVKATRSMMTMSALAPEMKRIQQEFADDRQKMNEELLAFYREHKINPVGGCLPMLLQIPFFIVLYQVIYGLTRRASETMMVNGTEVAEGTFLPKYLDQFPDTALYNDLLGSTTMPSLGMDLSRSAATALQDSFTAGLPYMFLILTVAGTAFLQQKQMSVRNPNVEMPPQQKILLRILPIFFAVISFNFAAGLVVYFFVSNVYRIFQNAAISMRLYQISGVQALLGIGATNLATGDGGSTSEGTATSTKPPGGKDGKSTDGTTSKDDAPGDRPGKANQAKKGSAASDRGAKGKNRGARNQNRSDSDRSAGNGKPTRPPSGRVTPPKSEAGGRATPPRRKKKRS